MSKYVRKKASDLDNDTPRTQLSKQLAKVRHQFFCHLSPKFFCRPNWEFLSVQLSATFQIEIRPKVSRPDHLQQPKVKILIRRRVIQVDVLRLLKVLSYHLFLNSKCGKNLNSHGPEGDSRVPKCPQNDPQKLKWTERYCDC